MSNLLNLSSILHENTISKSLIRHPVNETYLNSAIRILEQFNSQTNDITLSLYKSLSESTSRSEENDNFAQYFKDYKSLVNDYIRNMNELVSKFSINISTYIDANKSIIDNSDSITIQGKPTIKIYEFKNLDDGRIPHVDIEKAFKKEFAFIGKMIQDLGSAVSNDEAKANILATVCNNLSESIQSNWLEDCMKDIANLTDEDNCKKDNFATIMYKKFIPGDLVELEITEGDVQQARLALLNASTLISSIESLNDEFSSGLQRVSDEIGSMFFRNKDMVMPIRTSQEGVADTDYKLSPTSFNQFNIFMSTKSTQITELCNLYLIAVGIKTDCIFKYIRQCVDILETSINGIDYTPNDSDSDISNDIDPAPATDDSTSEQDDIDDIDLNIDSENNNSFTDNNTSVEQDQTEEPDGNLTDNDESSSGTTDTESEFDEAAYLFEASAFEINRIFDKIDVLESAKLYITEADDFNDKKDGALGVIQSIINQLIAIVQKFIATFKDTITPAVEYISSAKYQEVLNKANPVGWAIDLVDTNKLIAINIDAPLQDCKNENLDDPDKYLESIWPDIAKQEGKSIYDKMYKYLVDVDHPYSKKEIKIGVDYLKNYKTNMNVVKKESDQLDGTKKNIINKAKTGQLLTESTTSLEQTMVEYFTEADSFGKESDKTDNNNTSDKNQTDNSSDQNNNSNTQSQNTQEGNTKIATKRAKTYFSVNSKILVAKMKIMKQTAMQHIKFLNHIAAIDFKQKNNSNNKEGSE